MPAPSDPTAARNVLLLLTDQQRADSIRAYGNGLVETPALDRLADRGVRFDRAYTPTAICTPARASLLTGQRPSRHGVIANTTQSWANPEALDPAACYPARLRAAGYDVGLVGKWHLETPPSAFGFDGEHYPGCCLYAREHDPYEAYLDERGFDGMDVDALEELRTVPGLDAPLFGRDPRPVEASFTRFLAERVIDLLECYAGRDWPFYLSGHFFGPHLPYVLPEPYYGMYDPDDVTLPESAVRETFRNKPAVHRTYSDYWGLGSVETSVWREILAKYLGFVTLIDHEVGRILDRLEELELAAETATLYTADHGGFATAHKLQDKGPAMYEGVYRVPLIGDWPGTDGGTCEPFVSLLDVAPTVLDVAGADPLAEADGRSLSALSDGDASEWRDAVLAEFHGHHFPYQQRMLRTDRYKYVLNVPGTDEFYDLRRDPHELDDRVDDAGCAGERDRLRERLFEELEAAGDDRIPRTDAM